MPDPTNRQPFLFESMGKPSPKPNRTKPKAFRAVKCDKRHSESHDLGLFDAVAPFTYDKPSFKWTGTFKVWLSKNFSDIFYQYSLIQMGGGGSEVLSCVDNFERSVVRLVPIERYSSLNRPIFYYLRKAVTSSDEKDTLIKFSCSMNRFRRDLTGDIVLMSPTDIIGYTSSMHFVDSGKDFVDLLERALQQSGFRLRMSAPGWRRSPELTVAQCIAARANAHAQPQKANHPFRVVKPD